MDFTGSLAIFTLFSAMFGKLFGSKITQQASATGEIKLYATYNDALQDCKGKAYEDVELCSMIAAKTSRYSKVLLQKPFQLIPSQTFFVASFYQFLSLTGKKSVTIADLGGACGTHYFELKRFLKPEIELKWLVIETPEMVRAAQRMNLENKDLKFVTSLEQITDTPDILHSSSTLQYVPDPYGTLTSLAKSGIPWLFFNRMMFTEGNDDLITVQSSPMSANGPGPMPEGFTDKTITYPHTNMSFQRFHSNLLEHYTCEWMFDEPSGNIMKGHEKIIGKGLLYCKK